MTLWTHFPNIHCVLLTAASTVVRPSFASLPFPTTYNYFVLCSVRSLCALRVIACSARVLFYNVMLYASLVSLSRETLEFKQYQYDVVSFRRRSFQVSIHLLFLARLGRTVKDDNDDGSHVSYHEEV